MQDSVLHVKREAQSKLDNGGRFEKWLLLISLLPR